MTRIAKHFHRKSVGNTLRFGRLMPSSILNEAFIAGESAAQRLEALSGLKLEPRVFAEVTQARHDIGNLLQCLVYFNQELIRLQTERDNLLKQVEAETNDTEVARESKANS
jgi:hypothetical protein